MKQEIIFENGHAVGARDYFEWIGYRLPTGAYLCFACAEHVELSDDTTDAHESHEPAPICGTCSRTLAVDTE